MVATVKVTVTNKYLRQTEVFICRDVDISDMNEVEYCAEECCGAYLDMHHDVIRMECPDISSEEIEEACEFIVERVDE